MKELLLQYARFNIWANKRMTDVMLSLDEAVTDQQINSSFPSIRQTVYHTWGAEDIWLQRLELTEQASWAPSGFTGSFATACQKWMQVSEGLAAFTERQFDDKAFSHVFQYYSLKKESFKNPVSGALMHAFNHSTYHRGQLVTMLRQVGVTKIPETDLIAFIRKTS